MNPPEVRPADEIRWAHDLLVKVLETPELREAICGSETSQVGAWAAVNALRWVLRQKHQTFGGSLVWFDGAIRSARRQCEFQVAGDDHDMLNT